MTPSTYSFNVILGLLSYILFISSKVNPLIDLTGTIRLYCALVENPTHNNASSNGENTFHYVEQKMLPTGNGTVMTSLTAGSSTPFSLTYDISNNTHIEDWTNLRAMVWLQNVSTKDVYQSAVATWPTAINPVVKSSTGIIALYPTIATNNITVEYQLQNNSDVQFCVENMLGETMITKADHFGFGLHTF